MMTLKTGRSSIFETFLISTPEDERLSSSQLMASSGSSGELYPSLMLGRVPPKKTGSAVLPNQEQFETQQETTLWMSCSPGHDSSDNDAEDLAVDVVDVSSDDDDALPTSQLTDRSSAFKTADCWSNNDRRLDGRSSKKCTPQPQMPVSAYALFYNDAKASIVGENPKAKFVKVAKIVATMWDQLDEETKEYYKRKARSRRFAQSLASSVVDLTHIGLDQEAHIKTRVRKVAMSFLSQKEPAQRRKYKQSCSNKFNGNKKLSDVKEIKAKPGIAVFCRRPDCLNVAVDDPRWSKDYCSPQCIVTHCKGVFNAWVSERQGTFQNM